MVHSYLLAEQSPLLLDDFIIQISACNDGTIYHLVTDEQHPN